MHTAIGENFITIFSILYGVNMYFQSFGAVAVVKCNAWFHVRERGVFGAIFGILISLGVYFAFDLGYKIVNHFGVAEVFFIPTVMLVIFWIADYFLVRNCRKTLVSKTLTPPTHRPVTTVRSWARLRSSRRC